jgi:hypothetical protein
MEYRWTSPRLDHALSHAHRVQEFVDFEFEAFALARHADPHAEAPRLTSVMLLATSTVMRAVC